MWGEEKEAGTHARTRARMHALTRVPWTFQAEGSRLTAHTPLAQDQDLAGLTLLDAV